MLCYPMPCYAILYIAVSSCYYIILHSNKIYTENLGVLIHICHVISFYTFLYSNKICLERMSLKSQLIHLSADRYIPAIRQAVPVQPRCIRSYRESHHPVPGPASLPVSAEPGREEVVLQGSRPDKGLHRGLHCWW